jgi:hypothetical protein
VPANSGVLPGSIPALVMDDESLPISGGQVLYAPDANRRLALGTRHKSPDVVLLDRSRMIVASGDMAREYSRFYVVRPNPVHTPDNSENYAT